MSWETAYNNMFNLKDEEDAKYHRIIPTLDYIPFRKHLEKVLEVVNSVEYNLEVWAKYKWELLNVQKEWGEEVFIWGIKPNGQPSVDIKWDVLGLDPRKYYLVHMAIEDFWGLGLKWDHPKLPNIWNLLP